MDDRSSAAPAPEEPRPRRPWRTVAVLVALVVMAYVVLRPRPVDRQPLLDVFDHLEAQGYAPNATLAGRFRPGDVLQLAEPDPAGGERALATPLLALRGEECFPELEPLELPFPLPQDEAAREATLGLEGARLAKVLPGLAIGDEAAASYKLAFERPRLVAYAKLDLSGRFAAGCVEKLRRAEASGDRLKWFGTVIEAVVAEGMTFEVTWRSGLSAELRLELENQAGEALEELADAEAPSAPEDESPAEPEAEPENETSTGNEGESEDLATAAAVRVAAKDERKTVLRSDAPVVLGYRTRPLQYEETVPAAASLPFGLAAAAFAAGDGSDLRSAFVDPSAGGAFAGRLAVRLRQSDGSWQRVGTGHAFRAGDRFRFEIESASVAFLYVFHQPAGGAAGELWPGGTGQDHRLEPGVPRQVPSPPAAFELDAEDASETFFVALAGAAGEVRRDEPLGNYVLRGLPEAGDARGVGITYEDDPWLYFEPSGEEDYLAAVRFELRRAARAPSP